jgi:hypothetical protein
MSPGRCRFRSRASCRIRRRSIRSSRRPFHTSLERTLRRHRRPRRHPLRRSLVRSKIRTRASPRNRPGSSRSSPGSCRSFGHSRTSRCRREGGSRRRVGRSPRPVDRSLRKRNTRRSAQRLQVRRCHTLDETNDSCTPSPSSHSSHRTTGRVRAAITSVASNTRYGGRHCPFSMSYIRADCAASARAPTSWWRFSSVVDASSRRAFRRRRERAQTRQRARDSSMHFAKSSRFAPVRPRAGCNVRAPKAFIMDVSCQRSVVFWDANVPALFGIRAPACPNPSRARDAVPSG